MQGLPVAASAGDELIQRAAASRRSARLRGPRTQLSLPGNRRRSAVFLPPALVEPRTTCEPRRPGRMSIVRLGRTGQSRLSDGSSRNLQPYIDPDQLSDAKKSSNASAARIRVNRRFGSARSRPIIQCIAAWLRTEHPRRQQPATFPRRRLVRNFTNRFPEMRSHACRIAGLGWRLDRVCFLAFLDESSRVGWRLSSCRDGLGAG